MCRDMPKYKLDDRGILTIVSEHDGGIFTLVDILKKITVILLMVSIVTSIGVYCFFYHDVPSTNAATDYCITSLTKFDIEYAFEGIFSKFEGRLDYWEETSRYVFEKGYALVTTIMYKIEMFRQTWR